jgi:hypothetical protein
MFPLKTRELKKGENNYNNFNMIIDGFLNLIVLTKNLKVILYIY